LANMTITKNAYGAYGTDSTGSSRPERALRYEFRPGVGYWFLQRMFVDFDISSLMTQRVTKVELCRRRQSSYFENPAGMSLALTAFVSNDESNPSVADGSGYPNKFKWLGSMDIVDNGATGATIVTDITSIFKVSNAVGGIMGIAFIPPLSSAASGTIIETDVWLEVTYEFIPPGAPTNLSPTTQQNPGLPILFSWQHSPTVSETLDPQNAWQLEISQSGTATINITQNNTDNMYLLPGGSLSNYNNVTFRARTSSTINGYGSWASRTITLGEIPPLSPTPVFPTNNITVPYTDVVIFEWLFNTTVDVLQGGFELEITQDGVMLNTITQTTNNRFYEFEADGYIHNYEWRIRTWNELNEMGAWSQWASFNTSGRPQAPAILSVSNHNMPLVRWGMYGGLNWQLVITQGDNILYDTGIRPESLSNEYRIPIFLSNGSYTAKLRTISDLNVESDYSLFNFTLNPEKPEPVTPIVMQNNKYAITLKFNEEAEGEKAIIRDGVEVGRTTGSHYDDYFSGVNKLHTYVVRRIVDFNFSESTAYHGRVDFLGTFIAPVNNPEDFVILDRQIGTQPAKSKNLSIGKRAIEVIGREYTITEFSGAKSQEVSLSYFIDNERKADIEKLERFAQSPEIFIVRHRKYGVIMGTIEISIDYTDAFGYGVSLKIRKTET